jgi:hypothetical protein
MKTEGYSLPIHFRLDSGDTEIDSVMATALESCRIFLFRTRSTASFNGAMRSRSIVPPPPLEDGEWLAE